MSSRLELKVPPVALVLATAALMWLVAKVAPSHALPIPYRIPIALGFALLGVVVSVLGVAAFQRAQTTVNPMTPDSSTSLVVSGIYERTRNPMYLWFALVLLGWAAFLASLAALSLLPGFVLYVNRFQIMPEERALRSRFGRQFAEYCRRVRRWI